MNNNELKQENAQHNKSVTIT